MARTAGDTGIAALTWEPTFRLIGSDTESPGSGFPRGIEIYRQAYRNRPGDVRVDEHWTCAPRTVAEVVALVNWAHRAGWHVRDASTAAVTTVVTAAVTMAVTTTVTAAVTTDVTDLDVPERERDRRTLLLDLSRHMNRARVDGGVPASVTALAGITMRALLTQLEQAGYGVTSCPATGELTLGAALAIGAHGAAIPAAGETRAPGHTYGSISNLIVSLTAVVWDATQHAYVARTVQRSDPRIGALLTHFGRAFIVAATLRVGRLQRLRCVSRTDLGAAGVFAPPATAGPLSFAALLEGSGRIESRWFPFTPAPWLKIWSVVPERPATSREVDAPYNYPFADELTDEQSALITQLVEGDTWVTPLYTGLAYAGVVAGLRATASVDLWGAAKNTQLCSRPTTLRVTSRGYVVLTTRQRIQHVVSTFYDYLSSTLERYRAEGSFPINGPWELRVTGLDDPTDSEVVGAQSGQFSAIRSRADHMFDTAIWLNVHTLPGTPGSEGFYADLESWLAATFDAPHEEVRPEWPHVRHDHQNADDGRDLTVMTAGDDDRDVTLTMAHKDGDATFTIADDGRDVTVMTAGDDREVTLSMAHNDADAACTTVGNERGVKLTIDGDGWDTAFVTLDRLDPDRVYSSAVLDRPTVQRTEAPAHWQPWREPRAYRHEPVGQQN